MNDANWDWKAVKVGVTVTESTVIPSPVRVWRWKLRGQEIIESKGLWGWLRPLVRPLSLHDLMIRAMQKQPDLERRIMEGNAVLSRIK